MRLTTYLLTPPGNFATLASQLDASWVPITPSTSPGYPCRLWLKTTRPAQPAWNALLAPHFPLTPLRNHTHSALLAVRVEQHTFVLAFGHGWRALAPHSLAFNFGLRVALNCLKDGKLDTIDSRSQDHVGQRTRTHVAQSVPFADLGLDPSIHWLEAARGPVNATYLRGKVRGSHGIQFNFNGDLKKLRPICQELLALYHSKTYRKRFPFIDHIKEVQSHEPVHRTLENELRRLLAERNTDRLAIAHPSMPDLAVTGYKLTRHFSIHYGDLDLSTVQHFLDSFLERKKREADPDEVDVVGYDDHAPPTLSPKRKLRDYLSTQLELQGSTYLLSQGRWFQVDRDLLKATRARMQAIPDITNTLRLPTWHSTEQDENAYNLKVAAERGWLCLDRHPDFYVQQRDNRFECADLVTDTQDFICVKTMKGSAKLSHLFAQGSVAAQIYNGDPRTQQKLQALYTEQFKRKPTQGKRRRVVYAIATDKAAPLAESIYFFSQLNLLQHTKRLDELNWDYALCKITRPTQAPPKAGATNAPSARPKPSTTPKRRTGSRKQLPSHRPTSKKH